MNLKQHKYTSAALVGVALIPYVGDSVRGFSIVSKGVRGSDRLAHLVGKHIDSLPMSEAQKTKVLGIIPRAANKMPYEYLRGEANNTVYASINGDYVGITKNFSQRAADHRRIGREIEPLQGMSGLTRGQARAVEEFCILQGRRGINGGLVNKNHSIRPGTPNYHQALTAAKALMDTHGAKCPLYR